VSFGRGGTHSSDALFQHTQVHPTTHNTPPTLRLRLGGVEPTPQMLYRVTSPHDGRALCDIICDITREVKMGSRPRCALPWAHKGPPPTRGVLTVALDEWADGRTLVLIIHRPASFLSAPVQSCAIRWLCSTSCANKRDHGACRLCRRL
jgi:hypothetical protein